MDLPSPGFQGQARSRHNVALLQSFAVVRQERPPIYRRELLNLFRKVRAKRREIKNALSICKLGVYMQQNFLRVHLALHLRNQRGNFFCSIATLD